jgi:putative phosphoesterase
MRIAILSDIHGNDIALRAVLEHIEEQGGVDAYWVLGDLVALGHAPVKVLEMLREVPNVKIIRGNTDSYICNDTRPRPSIDDVKADINLLKQLVEVEGNFSWTKGAVTCAGWLAWLSRLPIEYRDKLPDGTQVLCVHASPGRDDGSGIRESMDQREIEALLLGAQESLICVGHTHRPFSITVNNKHIVNPGSISNPLGKDVRASYAILEASELGYKVELLRVDYNQGAVIEQLEGMRHPARRSIIKHLRGERA